MPSPNDRIITVLIADDSPVTRMLLVRLLESDPQIRVTGVVDNGQAALDFVKATRPDVVVMDIYMPGLDGFEATRLIMESRPVPIVICSAVGNPNEVTTAFRSMEAGAVACIEKPTGPEHPEFDAIARNLLQTVKAMSEVKVVRRWPQVPRASLPAQTRAAKPATTERTQATGATESRIVGIGTSTGGPPVLQTILGGLPKDFAAPILIVQHIARGFLRGLSDWLHETTALPVHIASYGTFPLPGHVYLAPDDFHMGLGATGRILLTHEAPENGLRPAVSFLFRSLAENCGRNAIGVLLTGMGKDGAAELKLMHDKGAITVAQDSETSVVNGMPGEAVALGAATHVLPPEKIPGALLTWLERGNFTARSA